MTTPVKIVMPYGVTVQGLGASQAQIVGSHPKKYNDYDLTLTPGPCQVAASWAGPESVKIVNYNQNSRKVTNVATIPEKAGGGSRRIMVTVGALAGDRISLTGSAALTAGATGTLEVYPMPNE